MAYFRRQTAILDSEFTIKFDGFCLLFGHCGSDVASRSIRNLATNSLHRYLCCVVGFAKTPYQTHTSASTSRYQSIRRARRAVFSNRIFTITNRSSISFRHRFRRRQAHSYVARRKPAHSPRHGLGFNCGATMFCGLSLVNRLHNCRNHQDPRNRYYRASYSFRDGTLLQQLSPQQRPHTAQRCGRSNYVFTDISYNFANIFQRSVWHGQFVTSNTIIKAKVFVCL